MFLIILLIVLGAVIYFELRFMRSRNKDYVKQVMEKDEVHNAITTTQAIASSLRQRGRDTKEAENILSLAESAYIRKDLSAAKGLAMKARDILVSLPVVAIAPIAQEAPVEQPDPERKTVQEVKKLEPHMLESRFIINSCRDRLRSCSESGMDVKEAEGHLTMAERSFEEKKYDEALKEGMKARRLLCESSSDTAEPVKDAVIVKIPKPETKCEKCSATVNSDDLFCRKCGAPIIMKRSCAHCQAEMGDGDVFCPKCGRRA